MFRDTYVIWVRTCGSENRKGSLFLLFCCYVLFVKVD